MEKSDYGESDREGNGCYRVGVCNIPMGEHGFDPMRNKRLADPTQPEAGKSDPQLGGGKGRIQMASCAQGKLHAPAAFFLERPQLTHANLHERKLRGDEEAIRDHQRGNDQRFESEAEESVHRNGSKVSGVAQSR